MSTTEDARRLAELTEQIAEHERTVRQLKAEKDALLNQLHPAFNDDLYSEIDFGDGKLVRTSRLGAVTYGKGSSERVEQLNAFRGCAETMHLIDESLHWRTLQSWLQGMVGDDVAAECFHYSDQELGQIIEAGIPSELVGVVEPIRRASVKVVRAGGRTRNTKRRLYSEQRGRCAECKREIPFDLLEQDHRYPKSRGGPNTEANTQLLCGTCNKRKGDRLPEEIED